MLNCARQHICDGLNAPVRMPRKAFFKIFGQFIAKIIKQQERIHLGGILKTKGTVQFDTGSFKRGRGLACLESRAK